MRGTVMYSAGDVRIEDVADPTIQEPTDAVIRVTRACICGSDLWPYQSLKPEDGARVMGHEASATRRCPARSRKRYASRRRTGRCTPCRSVRTTR